MADSAGEVSVTVIIDNEVGVEALDRAIELVDDLAEDSPWIGDLTELQEKLLVVSKNLAMVSFEDEIPEGCEVCECDCECDGCVAAGTGADYFDGDDGGFGDFDPTDIDDPGLCPLCGHPDFMEMSSESEGPESLDEGAAITEVE